MIAKADTKHINASHDYAALHEEATRLARRILERLDDGGMEPEGLHWGHVGSMAHYREQLRQINDSMFTEGEYAEDAR